MALKEFGGEKMTGAIRKKAEDLMRSEVAAYDSYLRGECYGFELYKNGELSDSCWGFMGTCGLHGKAAVVHQIEGERNVFFGDHLKHGVINRPFLKSL